MGPSSSRDIHQDLLDLFKSEDFIAYFELSVTAPGQPPISGLCKISRSKKEEVYDAGHSGYLSLILIMDTPDDESHRAVRGVMYGFDEDSLRRFLPELDMMIPMPDINVGSHMYVKHVDVTLKTKSFDERSLIMDRIVPFFRECLNAEVSNIEWWEDRVRPAAVSKRKAVQNKQEPDSLFNKVKRLLGR